MEKLDLVKQDKAYYNPPAKPTALMLGALPYLAITDKGNPSGPVFTSATEALFTLVYAIKFFCKKQGNDFIVDLLLVRFHYFRSILVDRNGNRTISTERNADQPPHQLADGLLSDDRSFDPCVQGTWLGWREAAIEAVYA